jgi:hypothetical protein
MKTLSARAGCVNLSDECGNWSACSVEDRQSSARHSYGLRSAALLHPGPLDSIGFRRVIALLPAPVDNLFLAGAFAALLEQLDGILAFGF